MEQEGDTSIMAPLWASNGDLYHHNRRRLRRSYSLLLTSSSLLVLFIVIALVFTLVVVPTLRSFASNVLRPHTVKNSWDSLNLVLILFAIVCGLLSKNTTTETQSPGSHYRRTFSNPSTPPPWYQYSDTHRSFNRLRSFNSYPDLRQHSSFSATDERYRFYDDTHLALLHRQQRTDAEGQEEVGFENVATAPPQSPPPQHRTNAGRRNVERMYRTEAIEKHEASGVAAEISQPPPQSPPSPPPQPRTESVRRNVKRMYRTETIEKHEESDVATASSQPPPSPQPQSPPSPPPQLRTKTVRRNVKRTYQKEPIEEPGRNDSVAMNSQPPPPVQGKKKRGISTKEFLLTSLRGKKKQRQRSVENFDSIINSEPFPLAPQPPLPPSPSVFQNLFSSKKGKHQKRTFVSVATTHISNKREHSSYSSEDNVMITGNESPLIPIPPPPPPPPFKLPAWKFRVQGDFVRIDSIGSSRSGSPDLDEVNNVDSPTTSTTQDESSQCNSPFAPYGEDPSTATATAPSLFCPSPDVDTKAHNFIESFRAGLRMAKMNSMKEKQGIGRSNLGPSLNTQTINGSRTS
ncbi:verprolin-like [Abrus precatorius]|uniref:Verprolin-like n=1 Tax=Abrus precatorius TaxID=3816 RepID=A0A8B8K2M6_ABRPR|nr:verprolin-like [Abrus precatorius]